MGPSPDSLNCSTLWCNAWKNYGSRRGGMIDWKTEGKFPSGMASQWVFHDIAIWNFQWEEHCRGNIQPNYRKMFALPCLSQAGNGMEWEWNSQPGVVGRRSRLEALRCPTPSCIVGSPSVTGAPVHWASHSSLHHLLLQYWEENTYFSATSAGSADKLTALTALALPNSSKHWNQNKRQVSLAAKVLATFLIQVSALVACVNSSPFNSLAGCIC